MRLRGHALGFRPVDAADLESRALTFSGWIPPEPVSLLVERGRLDDEWPF